uniref:Self-incompatibility-linked fibrinogen-like protein-A n=1 Tax=Ciona intestinalis TaxID=7719 RepID=A0A143RFT1_CIOIN|nr:self-incompatibility-linked fibrinogen-like protein-A [Ciona intestinalis]
MRSIIYCILFVLLENNRIVASKSTPNFTTNNYHTQLQFINVVRKVSRTRNVQLKRKTTCSTVHKVNLVQLQVDNTAIRNQTVTRFLLFQDCNEIYKAGHLKSDVYPIWLQQLYKLTYVFCDMDVQAVSNKTGWITIQKRVNGAINFDRGWQNYVDGFGNVRGEYWIGLENIHALSNQNTTTDWLGSYVTAPRMRIDLHDQDGISAYAEYKLFKVAEAKEKYRLIIAQLNQATAIPSNVPSPITRIWFSTFDNDDQKKCPEIFHSGWWFFACGESNLNGLYPKEGDKNSPSNIFWYYWYTVNENNTAFRSVSMKFQY